MLRVFNVAGGAVIPVGPVYQNRSLDYSTSNLSSYTIELPQSSSPALDEVLFDGNGPGDRAWLVFVCSEDASTTSTLSSLTLEGASITGSQLQTTTSNQLYCSSYLVAPPTLSGGDADFVVNFGTLDTQQHCSVHIVELSGVRSVTAIDSAEWSSTSDNAVNQVDLTVSAEPGAMVILFGVSELSSTPSLTRTGFFANTLPTGEITGSLGNTGHFILGQHARGSDIGDFSVSANWSSGDMIVHAVAVR